MKIHWPNTILTEILKIRLPLIQAPMAGGATTPALIAAVSNAGGLGALGAGYMNANEIRSAIKEIRKLTDHSFCVNLFIPQFYEVTNEQIEITKKILKQICPELNILIDKVAPPYLPSFEEQMNVVLEEKVPVFSFTFGIPSENIINALKSNGTVIIGTATSVTEAVMLEKTHVDAVVAQGMEAGGHRATFLGNEENALTNISFLAATMTHHIQIPVIASGGIMDAKGIYAAMQTGISGVQMGTAFLCCPESGIHPFYKQLLLNPQNNVTTLTRAFSGKLARGLLNKFIIQMQIHEDAILPYPAQNALTTPMRKEAAKKNRTDFMSMWAGENFHLCKAIPAEHFIRLLNEEMLVLINKNNSEQ
jgi:nitronate monooxygenase